MKTRKLKQILTIDLNWQQLVGALIFLYISFAVGILLFADRSIFRPPTASYRDDAQIIKVPVINGEKISAVDLPNSTAKYTILYIHGNGEDLGQIRPNLQLIHQAGFRVFAYDYRGYGTSDGTAGESNAYRDGEAAYTYLTQTLKIRPQQIIIYGRSLGGGSAVELATRHRVGGLILESTFTSAFRTVVPFPIVPFDKFTNLDKIPNIKCPVLVLHGTSDRVVPTDHSKQLYTATTAPKMSLYVAGAGHDDLSIVAGNDYERILREFRNLVVNSQTNRSK